MIPLFLSGLLSGIGSALSGVVKTVGTSLIQAGTQQLTSLALGGLGLAPRGPTPGASPPIMRARSTELATDQARRAIFQPTLAMRQPAPMTSRYPYAPPDFCNTRTRAGGICPPTKLPSVGMSQFGPPLQDAERARLALMCG